MTEKKNSVYRVLVSAARDEAGIEAGQALRLRFLVKAPSPKAARMYLPGKAYSVDGACREAWTLPVVQVTSIKKDPKGVVPDGLTIVGLDAVSALSLRVMAAVQVVHLELAA